MSAIADYIVQLQSYEEYAFSWDEIRRNCKSPESTLRKELVRLIGRKEIIPLRQGYYLILPPQYRDLGKLPVQLYADKFFRFLGKPYYLALFTASAFHGASHQRLHQDYIVSLPPALRAIQSDNVKVRFFHTRNWPERNIEIRVSDAGSYNLSTPALTAADLIRYQKKIGGLNRILSNLAELTSSIHTSDLSDLLNWYPHTSTLQRLGYLLEALQADNALSELMITELTRRGYYPILLNPERGTKAGRVGNRWKIDINLKLDIE